jgi:predicted RNA-binding protein with PIN domain
MPVLLDGNNLLHRLPARNRNREELRRLVLESCRHERMTVIVVFDGPPPAGAPPRESLGAVSVVYAGSETADDVIIRSLPGGRAARNWVVVTDDRALQERARQRHAQVRSVAEWSRKKPGPPSRSRTEPKLSSHEVAEWEEYFTSGDEEKGPSGEP